MSRIRLVLLDIEGTTLPIAFVRDTLFPYAARTLPALLETQGDDPRVRVALGDIEREFPGRAPLDVIRDWMARDIKAAPLKTLQGLAWKQGFDDGELRARLYDDVPPALEAWHTAGLRLAVYSSGSANAQRQLYGHTQVGDLTRLFEAFYDLDIGGKKVAESYTEIAERAGVLPGEILFLSDVGAELDAARAAGMRICQLVRAQDDTRPYPGVPQAVDLAAVAKEFGLPVA
ncbi:2,3-diketo-5-methylthio-1-phosphopentane phosphatase [Neoasaia chiangmaiensis NBRC 101099]|uniref:Enolase-phosphatase E1 n=1 Tax=Neoasaia chiangmaiensis TaxID=320497 RepID=A0A1U9KQ78_9PROT|nr:acireductone synthase [Neoasaia chiangmaiensis]AQS87879.1 2,3-diketo-5-methylthio-1-phosphopentane phosphatase [Neoasaia chiangmaiensis]GBR39194.1 2,3-diketo-5-methylthio-1-phosphopentane phosphatase [Neoasaia chiangmaiensis NBRC 101099]GEN15526.1 enolase-phosphatase E1 [Neoasaia chiangmaiensis]